MYGYRKMASLSLNSFGILARGCHEDVNANAFDRVKQHLTPLQLINAAIIHNFKDGLLCFRIIYRLPAMMVLFLFHHFVPRVLR